MQDEMAADGLPLEVQILGINPAGMESGNADMCNGRDLPWLQESAGVSVWTSWAVTYRDVVIVDAANEKVTAYNLTTNDLGVAANYAALKDLLRSAASPAGTPQFGATRALTRSSGR
jgi:hypothetical protein